LTNSGAIPTTVVSTSGNSGITQIEIKIYTDGTALIMLKIDLICLGSNLF
jgi:hypothetical protein